MLLYLLHGGIQEAGKECDVIIEVGVSGRTVLSVQHTRAVHVFKPGIGTNNMCKTTKFLKLLKS